MPDAVEAVPAPPTTETPAAPAEGAPPPPPVTEPAPAPRNDFAERMALLARQTKSLAAEKQRAAEERRQAEAAIKAREDAITAKIAKLEEFEKRQAAALTDPGSFLRGTYGDEWYDRLTQFKLEGEKGAPVDLAVQAVRQELQQTTKALRDEQEQRWKAAEEERKKAAEEARSHAEAQQRAIVDQFRRETAEFVSANPEKYELINLYDAGSTVVQVIEETFAKSKRLMTAEEAADLVESHLEEQAAKFYAGKRWAAKMAEKQKAAEPANGAARTLTNGAATGSPAPASDAKLDRYARAVAAMEAAAAQAAGKA